MAWAIALEDREDAGGVLLLADDRREADSIATEVRRRGHPVIVRPYPYQSPAAHYILRKS
jgi:hypothetical protein